MYLNEFEHEESHLINRKYIEFHLCIEVAKIIERKYANTSSAVVK